MKNNLIVCLFFFLLSGCIQKKDSVFHDSKFLNYEVFGDELILDEYSVLDLSDSLFKPTVISIAEDFLFVNERVSDKIMHLIDLKSGHYLGMRGNRGAGPGEALNVWHFLQGDEGEIGVFDTEQGKILIYSLDSLVKRYSEPIIEFQHKDLVYSKAISQERNSVFFMGNPIKESESNKRFYKIDFESSSEVLSYGQIPFEDLRIPDISNELVRKTIFNSRLIRAGSNIFIFYQNIPMIELYNIETVNKVTITGPDPVNFTEDFGSLYYFSSAFVSNNYVYFSYVTNREFKDYNANTILVFDHFGNPVKRFVLKKAIYSFSIYKDKYLYGLSEGVDGMEYEIIKYDLETKSD